MPFPQFVRWTFAGLRWPIRLRSDRFFFFQLLLKAESAGLGRCVVICMSYALCVFTLGMGLCSPLLEN